MMKFAKFFLVLSCILGLTFVGLAIPLGGYEFRNEFYAGRGAGVGIPDEGINWAKQCDCDTGISICPRSWLTRNNKVLVCQECGTEWLCVPHVPFEEFMKSQGWDEEADGPVFPPEEDWGK